VRLVTLRDGSVGEVVDDRVHVLEADSMIEWLSGEGGARTGAVRALADVELAAPVPEPPSVRDFFAYEGHVAAGFRRRGHDRIPEE
jgi:fumarylacetoacetate (FAA) hydrolase